MYKLYKLCIVSLLLLCSGIALAQPSMLAPAKTTSTLLTTKKPTFQWSQVTSATAYQLYVTSSATDTTTYANATTTPPSSKKLRTTGNTTLTINDTVLAENTVYYWIMRSKVSGTWSNWSHAFYFKIGAPNSSMSNANAVVTFNHDTLGAITGLRYFQGSNKQILDTAYNSTNSLGLGASSTSPDTIVSWYTSANTDTNIFTYQNGPQYGNTGSKVLTVFRGTDGVTANIATTLETAKTINVATAWTPGGSASGVDNVLLVKNSAATKTLLTYPSTPASFGPDSITLSAMYDTSYGEYFGFKSSSPIAVTTTQSTGLLKQVLSFSNTTGSTATYSYSFAVRQTRDAYFNIWANNRPIVVTKPASGDSVTAVKTYVVWESFGATPNSISFSKDGGSTFGTSTSVSGHTASVDSVQYSLPAGAYQSNCVMKVTSSQGDAGTSGVFKVAAHLFTVTSPKTGDVVSTGKSYVVWQNPTYSGVVAVEYSIDGGTTWIGTATVSPADSASVDSLLFDFQGAKVASANSLVRIRTNASDTAVSGIFTLGKGNGAVFSIPTVIGSPGAPLIVTLRAKDCVAGDSITSFQLKMNFDSTFVHFDSVAFAPLLQNPNWFTVMDSSNTRLKDSNYVSLIGIKYQGYGITDSAIAKLYFTVKDNDTIIIGKTDTLFILNSSLAASGNKALKLDISNSTNGLLKIYSSIAGNLRYMHEKNTSASYNISGSKLMVYHDYVDSVNNDGLFDVVGGKFTMLNREPNDSIIFYPSASAYGNGLDSINVYDALLVLKDALGTDTLSTRAKIVADVNGDSVVNATDAEMILNIS
ncbi:MAG TPA: dockerin type I repeat-containing protein, partial [Bacteroidota bacterium]|nr:dockerin type I repeat-containing protein [Bacteroidota bacterium]